MAETTIPARDAQKRRLKHLKRPDESYWELLDRLLNEQGVPPANELNEHGEHTEGDR